MARRVQPRPSPAPPAWGRSGYPGPAIRRMRSPPRSRRMPPSQSHFWRHAPPPPRSALIGHHHQAVQPSGASCKLRPQRRLLARLSSSVRAFIVPHVNGMSAPGAIPCIFLDIGRIEPLGSPRMARTSAATASSLRFIRRVFALMCDPLADAAQPVSRIGPPALMGVPEISEAREAWSCRDFPMTYAGTGTQRAGMPAARRKAEFDGGGHLVEPVHATGCIHASRPRFCGFPIVPGSTDSP